MITEPVVECRIIYRYTYRNFFGDLSDHTEEFVSLDNFQNYLRWEPERAALIGFAPLPEERMKNARSSNVRLALYIKDQTTADEVYFKDYDDLHAFIIENPPIARKLGFVQ